LPCYKTANEIALAGINAVAATPKEGMAQCEFAAEVSSAFRAR
jgi:hypothetical protein